MNLSLDRTFIRFFLLAFLKLLAFVESGILLPQLNIFTVQHSETPLCGESCLSSAENSAEEYVEEEEEKEEEGESGGEVEEEGESGREEEEGDKTRGGRRGEEGR